MLTLNQKGQIQRELEGETELARLLAPQYLHLLVEGMSARWAPDVHFGDHVFIDHSKGMINSCLGRLKFLLVIHLLALMFISYGQISDEPLCDA